MKTRCAVIAALSLLGMLLPAQGLAAQQVEYVTRNVSPKHAVRFNAEPIRITLTDRGKREPLASSPVVKHRKDCKRRCCRSGRTVGGLVVITTSTPKAEEKPARKSRTVYGKDRGTRSASARAGVSAPRPEAVVATDDRADDGERRRHMLRCLALIQARKDRIAQKTSNASADDR